MDLEVFQRAVNAAEPMAATSRGAAWTAIASADDFDEMVRALDEQAERIVSAARATSVGRSAELLAGPMLSIAAKFPAGTLLLATSRGVVEVIRA